MEFANVQTGINKHQGNVGAARAIYEYTRLGYTVLAPLSDSDKYDLVIDDGEQLLKVQVKTTRQHMGDGRYQAGIKSTGGNRKINTIRNRQEGDYDVLFLLTESGRCWSIPVEELGSVCASVSVGGTKYSEFELLGR